MAKSRASTLVKAAPPAPVSFARPPAAAMVEARTFTNSLASLPASTLDKALVRPCLTRSLTNFLLPADTPAMFGLIPAKLEDTAAFAF